MMWLKDTARNFSADRSGMALVYVSLLLPAIVGFSVLVIDMSRIGNLHNDLQKGADSYALAAAAELDGAPDAWTRAERALENLVDNTTKFSTGGNATLASSGSVTINPSAAACRSRGSISWCFLDDLPALDSSAITSTHYAASAFDTRFIEVKVNPTGFANIFPISFLSGNTADNSQTVSATAVAGFLSGVCDFTPVYICNPYEGQTPDFDTVMSTPSLRKRMIELRQQGGTAAQNSPGNYGFLQPPPSAGNGANVIRDMIANISSPACYSSRLVEVKPASLRQFDRHWACVLMSMKAHSTVKRIMPTTHLPTMFVKAMAMLAVAVATMATAAITATVAIMAMVVPVVEILAIPLK